VGRHLGENRTREEENTMPEYRYTCGACGKARREITVSITEKVPSPRCCRRVMGRDYRSNVSFKAGYDKPILSDGLGVMPNQIPEAMTLHPDREYLPDGRLVMRSHTDRNRYLKEDGYHDNN
jgi:hypothetical protein